jgi:Arf-GAP/GTPase/ANK repeat/PH domain-containing protein 1/3
MLPTVFYDRSNLKSEFSALVHRYLTGSYVNDESPEGGRFKKEVNIEGDSHLLLIRDEAGLPDHSLCSWADGVLLIFSLADEESFRLVSDYSKRFAHQRPNLPLLLIGTQDSLGTRCPRVIDDVRARKLAQDLNGDYIETCATYGMNVERVFSEVALKVLRQRSHVPSAGGAQVQLPISRTKLSTTPLRGQLGRASLYPQNDGESSGRKLSIETSFTVILKTAQAQHQATQTHDFQYAENPEKRVFFPDDLGCWMTSVSR